MDNRRGDSLALGYPGRPLSTTSLWRRGGAFWGAEVWGARGQSAEHRSGDDVYDCNLEKP